MMNEPRFDCTGYAGHEEEILAFRNRIRIVQQDRAYLDWRYLGEQTGREPLVFWLRDETSRPLAMAAVIFRRYVIDEKPALIAVLGDIGVDPAHRRRGLAVRLFEHIN